MYILYIYVYTHIFIKFIRFSLVNFGTSLMIYIYAIVIFHLIYTVKPNKSWQLSFLFSYNVLRFGLLSSFPIIKNSL